MTHPPASAAAPFTPVPVRYRRDGWTPTRQFALIAALWEKRCVLAACRAVGMSAESAYQLARRPDAADFRRAWAAVLAAPRRAPPSAPAPESRPAAGPAYSLAAFRRVALASRAAAAGAPSTYASTSVGDGKCKPVGVINFREAPPADPGEADSRRPGDGAASLPRAG
jgi:hypothetical protein